MAIGDAHDLVAEDLAATIPPVRGTEEQSDPVARVKLFTPDSPWTWYITEYDPDNRICFGLVVGFEREFGSFALKELEELRGPWGLRVERDLYFQPTPVSQCR